MKRAMYYVARGLSRQLGELTEETDYGKLQKVYSIWVCYDPKMPRRLKNTASRYKIKKEDFFGKVEESAADYDLMEVVMVRLDAMAESNEELFDYLKGILTNNKEKIIRHTGTLSDDIIEEVDTMSGVGALIFETARTEGLAAGFEQGLEQERRNQIEKLLRKGKTPEDIAEYNDYPIELVKSIQESLTD
ncbi:MAG: hypothetical protein E7294_14275 [Lachnospiraceae bacterium]|nr:hypothetical protein [Lachnospiraceae bacterium]